MGDRGSGPSEMDDEEVRAWLARRPNGALCVERPDGRFEVLPAVVEASSAERLDRLVVSAPGTVPDGAQACVVADEFESYQGIRGVIVQGAANDQGGRIEIVVERRTSFSFAQPANESGAGSGR